MKKNEIIEENETQKWGDKSRYCSMSHRAATSTTPRHVPSLTTAGLMIQFPAGALSDGGEST